MRNEKPLFCSVIFVMCMYTGFAQQKVSSKITPTRSTTTAMNIAPEPIKMSSLHLGRYELYSGIPTMYIGNVVLLKDGKYKVAFSNDEDNYEIGNYAWHEDTHSIEWLTGMFRINNWKGNLVSKEKGFRIEFNKATYAESN